MNRRLLKRGSTTVAVEDGYVVIRQENDPETPGRNYGATDRDDVVLLEPEDVPRVIRWLEEAAAEAKGPQPAAT